MKIIIVCDLLSTFYRFRRFLAVELRARNHEVVVVAGTDDLPDKRYFSENSIKLEIVAMSGNRLNPFVDWKYSRTLKRIFDREHPDHILAYQAKAVVWASIAAKSLSSCKVTILFPGLGFLFASHSRAKHRMVQKTSRLLYRYALSNIDNAIFQNSDDIVTMQNSGCLSRKTRVALVNGSGVNLDEFSYSDPPIDPIKFVMASRLMSDKGIREFVEAAKQLTERYGTRVQFHIAGGYSTNPMAIKEEEVRGWESQGCVKYWGHIDDMVSYLRAASVFVLPSYYMEGTPRSILEALSTGRPIITTDNRGCKETVVDGVNGYLVSQRNVDSLSDAMEKLIQTPGLIATFGAASRKMAEEKYDVDLVNQQMIEIMGL